MVKNNSTSYNGIKTVLVIDDTVLNLDLVISFLSKEGYKTFIAKDGATGIKRAKKLLPDLILLDIQMPGIDGFETCKRLKTDSTTSEIPVIFMTALTEISDKLKGFDSGGVDYITKPIDCMELMARVDTHITLYRAKRELIKHNELLNENAMLKESMDQILRHDLKTPLSGLIMIPQVLLKSEGLSEEQRKLLKTMYKTGLKMLNMINCSMDLYKMEKNIYIPRFVKIDLIHSILSVIDIYSNNTINMTYNNYPLNNKDICYIKGEELLLFSLFNNLIKNSIEAIDNFDPIEIAIKDNKNVTIEITNSGVVPEDIRASFFDKFVTSGKDSGTGIGTYSAKLIVETLGGSISLDTSIKNKTSIKIKLPIFS